MVATPTKEFVLTLTAEEHVELLAILEQAHLNLRLEERRTDARRYREKILQQEAVLQRLLDKVRQLG